MGVDVRPVAEADIPAINEIHGHYVLHTAISFDIEPWTFDQRVVWMREHPDAGPHRAVVAVDGGDVVGWASTSRWASKYCYGTSVECSIMTRDGHQGRGIGRALYDDLFARVRGEDIHRMYAGVTIPNDGSIGLHEAFGFRQVAYYSECGRKFDRYWDVVWLERKL
jgi:phosphinothricin acetyltransferase